MVNRRVSRVTSCDRSHVNSSDHHQRAYKPSQHAAPTKVFLHSNSSNSTTNYQRSPLPKKLHDLITTANMSSNNNENPTSTLQSVVDQASAAIQSGIGALTGNPGDKVSLSLIYPQYPTLFNINNPLRK